ncbi:hypothetical protein JCM5353_008504 [Sporobolomyces roseus]
MSTSIELDSQTSIFPSIPAGGEWIEPFYSDILRSIQVAESPYLVIRDVIRHLYWPEVCGAFRVQMYILIGLLTFTICTMILAISLRYSHSRICFFLRLDRTVLIPSSILFPFCALVYAALGIAVVAGSIQVSRHEPYPPWWQGAHAAWIGPIWTGIFLETWACYAAWYIRRYGAHYRESTLRSAIALAIPFTLIAAAWSSTTWLFFTSSINFNTSWRWARHICRQLEVWQSQWSPTKGLEIGNLMQLFDPGVRMGLTLQTYSERSSCGSRNVVCILVITLIVYLVGAFLELSHISQSIRRLCAESRIIEMNTANRRSGLSSIANSTFLAETNSSIEEKLDDLFAQGRGKGVVRKWQLMEWAKMNRILTTACIAALLLVNSGLHLWKGLTPLKLRVPSAQFQTDILVSGWVNSILSTVVAILILLRSLDGSSPMIIRLKASFPILPLPPSLETVNSVGARQANATSGPPRHHFGGGGNVQSIIHENAREDEEHGDLGTLETEKGNATTRISEEGSSMGGNSRSERHGARSSSSTSRYAIMQ